MKIGVDAQMLCRPITGIERYASEMLREMIDRFRKDDFHLYAPCNPSGFDYSNMNNVTVRYANLRFKGGGLLSSQTYNPFWAARDRLDVYWGAAHRIPRMLSSRIARIVTIHDLVWKRASKTMRPMGWMAEHVFTTDAIRLADIIVADSQSTANDIAAEFPKAVDRVRVIYPGATAFPKQGGPGLLGKFGIEGSYFLFVGTLEPRKNLSRLLEAYSSLDSQVRGQYKLVIAGGKGWGNEDLASLVRALNIYDSVILTGYVSDQELATLYSHAVFLAMPSLYEGFGLPLVEAMSFGVPVLTSSRSSLPEVAGDAGILVDPEDVASIASGISKMFNDHKFRDSLAMRAKTNAARFSWKKSSQKMMNIFNEALSIRGKKTTRK